MVLAHCPLSINRVSFKSHQLVLKLFVYAYLVGVICRFTKSNNKKSSKSFNNSLCLPLFYFFQVLRC